MNLLLPFLGSRHCTCACIRWFKQEWRKYFCRFVFVCLIKNSNLVSKLKFNYFCFKWKIKKQFIDYIKINFLQSTKSPHFLLRGEVGQLSKKRRVLCWSIYLLLVNARDVMMGSCQRKVMQNSYCVSVGKRGAFEKNKNLNKICHISTLEPTIFCICAGDPLQHVYP